MTTNIIFLVIDSFRSDRFFGSDRSCKTPNIDSLINRGLYCKNTIGGADSTGIAIGNCITGKYSFKNGINQIDLNSKTTTLFDILKNYGYSLDDRQIVLEKSVEICKDKNKKGITMIVSTVSHKKAMRDYARSQIPQFIEVYLECPTKVCADRDYKGLYEKAKAGKYQTFAGVTEPYEPSENPNLVLNTSQMSIDECSAILFKSILGFLGNS